MARWHIGGPGAVSLCVALNQTQVGRGRKGEDKGVNPWRGLKGKDKDQTWHSHFVADGGAVDTARNHRKARRRDVPILGTFIAVYEKKETQKKPGPPLPSHYIK